MQIHSLYMRLHLSRLTSLVVIGVFVFMEVSQHIPTTRQTRDVFFFFFGDPVRSQFVWTVYRAPKERIH